MAIALVHAPCGGGARVIADGAAFLAVPPSCACKQPLNDRLVELLRSDNRIALVHGRAKFLGFSQDVAHEGKGGDNRHDIRLRIRFEPGYGGDNSWSLGRSSSFVMPNVVSFAVVMKAGVRMGAMRH